MYTCPFCKGSRICPNSHTANYIRLSLSPLIYSCNIPWCGHGVVAVGFRGKLEEHDCGACYGTGSVAEGQYDQMTKFIQGSKELLKPKRTRKLRDPEIL